MLLCIGKPNPISYGRFVSGKLTGVRSGDVSLKLTINADETLNLEYLKIPERDNVIEGILF